jgi:hypothetical protein
MHLLLLDRESVVTPRAGSHVCEARGHCGPFVNQAFYDAFPETLWHGMGDCVNCGTTRKVEREYRKQYAAPAAA